MTVYLGLHHDAWMKRAALRGVPMFISHRTLARRKSLPEAVTNWALDSGGFTQVTKFGGYSETPRHYARAVRRYRNEMGGLDWASIQDWMCEPFALAKTGKTLAEHQALTVRSWQVLTEIAPDLPWRPVLQGWRMDDYLRCLDLYHKAGALESGGGSRPYFGLGSVCRRQGMGEAARIVERLAAEGIDLHLFGFKRAGLAAVAGLSGVRSSDSMAWSFGGRRSETPCPDGKKSCSECMHYALDWYRETLRVAADPVPHQLTLLWEC